MHACPDASTGFALEARFSDRPSGHREPLEVPAKPGYPQPIMSLVELEQEIERLSPADFNAFTSWMDDYAARRCDAHFEADALSGKLDALGRRADRDFELGNCCEL